MSVYNTRLAEYEARQIAEKYGKFKSLGAHHERSAEFLHPENLAIPTHMLFLQL